MMWQKQRQLVMLFRSTEVNTLEHWWTAEEFSEWGEMDLLYLRHTGTLVADGETSCVIYRHSHHNLTKIWSISFLFSFVCKVLDKILKLSFCLSVLKLLKDVIWANKGNEMGGKSALFPILTLWTDKFTSYPLTGAPHWMTSFSE